MGVPEDVTHMWWECPAWEHIRMGYTAAAQAYNHSWPACLRCCGIMPEHIADLEDTLVFEATKVEPTPDDVA
eukprot:9751806-Karenia_brevis.AAC.1